MKAMNLIMQNDIIKLYFYDIRQPTKLLDFIRKTIYIYIYIYIF